MKWKRALGIKGFSCSMELGDGPGGPARPSPVFMRFQEVEMSCILDRSGVCVC